MLDPNNPLYSCRSIVSEYCFTSLSAQSWQYRYRRRPELCPTLISNDFKGSLGYKPQSIFYKRLTAYAIIECFSAKILYCIQNDYFLEISHIEKAKLYLHVCIK